MSGGPAVQDWLPKAGAHSLHTVRRHIAAETTADTDAICATVSRDVFFAVPLRTRAGNELPPGSVLTCYEEVRDYYANRADSYVVLASDQLKSVSTHWYVFNESAATLRVTGAIGNADAVGKEFMVNSAILFPTADDGIRGEICITRHPFEDVAVGRVPPAPADASFPSAEVDHAARLDALRTALAAGEPGEAQVHLSPRHSLAIRVDDPDGNPVIHTATEREQASSVLSQLFAGAADIALVSCLLSSWYVFAEYSLYLEGDERGDGGDVRHLALLHSVSEGRFTGSFGYGFHGRASR